MTTKRERRKEYLCNLQSYLNIKTLTDFEPANKRVVDGMYNAALHLEDCEYSRSMYEAKLRESSIAPTIQANYREKREWISKSYDNPDKQAKHLIKTWLKEAVALVNGGVYRQELLQPISQRTPTRSACKRLGEQTYYGLRERGFKVERPELERSFEPNDPANPKGCGLCNIRICTPAPK